MQYTDAESGVLKFPIPDWLFVPSSLSSLSYTLSFGLSQLRGSRQWYTALAIKKFAQHVSSVLLTGNLPFNATGSKCFVFYSSNSNLFILGVLMAGECLGSMETEDFLARFSVSFSWDYPDDWSLNDVICSIFHIVDDQDKR